MKGCLRAIRPENRIFQEDMTTRQWILVLGAAFLVMSVSIVYVGITPYLTSPDLSYVKAKSIWVLNGHLYNDPVTGVPTFHPPYYHLILSWFMRLGIHIDAILMVVSLLNALALGVFVFLTVRAAFNTTTAGLVVLLIPFINRYMGSDYLFLASSFTFSLPIFFAGLWLYVRKESTTLHHVAASICWGAAFLISPGYLFLLGFTFLYEMIVVRNYRRLSLMAITFLVIVSPIFYQAHVVNNSNVGTTTTFSLWRGAPGPDWLGSLLARMLAPTTGDIIDRHVPAVLAIIVIGVIGYMRDGRHHPFPIIALAAFVFTFYHFNGQYASRIYYVLSIFTAAHGIYWLSRSRKFRTIGYALFMVAALYGIGNHLAQTYDDMDQKQADYRVFQRLISRLQPALRQHVPPTSFVLTDAKTYNYFVMPYYPVRGLLAHKSGEYFQLPERLSEEMLKHYNAVMKSTDRRVIEYICSVYDIYYAVWTAGADFPVFDEIFGWWEPIAVEADFRIYRRPPALSTPEGVNR